jgi:hypothetical protein
MQNPVSILFEIDELLNKRERDGLDEYGTGTWRCDNSLKGQCYEMDIFWEVLKFDQYPTVPTL